MNLKDYFLLSLLVFSLVTVNTVYLKAQDELQTTLQSQLGSHVIIVNSVDINKPGKFKNIDDPDEILKDCTIFLALDTLSYNDKLKYDNMYAGIFRNNKLIWVSDSLSGVYHLSEIHNIMDLNNDGSVEIIFTLTFHPNIEIFESELYIISFDGSSVKYLNTIDSKKKISNLKIRSDIVDPIDLNQDGIYELEILGEYISDEMHYKYLTWNGLYYGLWDDSYTENDPRIVSFPFTDATKTNIQVSSKVDEQESNLYYTCKITCLENSFKPVENFSFNSGYNTGGNIPILVSDSLRILHYWFDYVVVPVSNTIGATSKIKFKSNFLPGIRQIFIQTSEEYIGIDELNSENYENLFLNDLGKNSIKKYIVFPLMFQDNITDSLSKNILKSFELGWIKNEQTRDKYISYVQTVKEKEQIGDSEEARNILDKIMSDAVTDSTENITSEAFALIYYNAEYLKSQDSGGVLSVPR